MTKQHLIFDADDTLWENNIYFEDAFDKFCAYLDHSELTPPAIRDRLDDIERENTKVHGYGARNFARNLQQCYRLLAQREWHETHLKEVAEFAHKILDSPMELIEGVAETLAELARHHELTLFTKGDPEEQNMKIDCSGLRTHFDHCAVVKEKNREAYLLLADLRDFDLDRTWMIGNSPKSDINPALAAGMRAVYLPHPKTWGLEKEDIPEPSERLKVVQQFFGLRDVFLV
jgi:putative hydrolase of the HAD superfamily